MTTPVGQSLTYFPVTGDYQSVNAPLPQSTTSAPIMGPIQGLVTFTPRVPAGWVAYVADYQISQDSNNTQTVQIIGAITGGAWTLGFQGVWTAPIAAGATAAEVQAALGALETVGTPNVTVTGNDGGPYTVEFVGTLANQPLPQLLSSVGTPATGGLTVSSGSPYITVVMLQPGSVSRVAPCAIAIPPLVARIWTTGELSAINVADSAGVELVANTEVLDLTYDLIYDVTFNSITYAGQPQSLAPFAFIAPTDGTPVCLTDPNLARIGFVGPLATTWFPGWTPSPTITGATITPLTVVSVGAGVSSVVA